MIDSLICAIGEKIRNTWEDEIAVYTESVYQGAVKPCFFVECEKAERIELLNRRFFVRVSVKVVFENDSDTKKYETDGIMADMFELLNLIEVDGRFLNGRKIYGKWEQGAFVIRSCYDVYAMVEDEEKAVMETIEVKEYFDGESDLHEE